MTKDARVPFRGILFDFDGTLSDTMEGNYRAWQHVLHEVGADIGREEYFLLEGMKLAEVARTLCEKHGVFLPDYGELARRKEVQYAGANHACVFYPDVDRFTARCVTMGIPIAIVTAALHDRITRSVPPEFLGRFAAVITGDMTERNKPFPDPYLKAAEMIGVPIAECIVVENAPLGIRSAKAAGAYCVAIASTLDASVLSEADAVVMRFGDIADLPALRSMLESSV